MSDKEKHPSLNNTTDMVLAVVDQWPFHRVATRQYQIPSIDRLDILCGFPMIQPIHACEKCKSEECEGKGKCKGYGAYSLGIKI